MATRTIRVCDGCSSAEAESYQFTLATQESFEEATVDLCATCAAPVQELLANLQGLSMGEIVIEASPEPAPVKAEFPCPRCDKIAASKSGLALHMKSAHKYKTVSPSRSRRGDRRAVPLPHEFFCEVPGCGAGFHRPNRLRNHMAAKHPELVPQQPQLIRVSA